MWGFLYCIISKLCLPLPCFCEKQSLELRYGVMVALQILVLSV